MYKKFLHSAKRGFTLNELLVVIAIIGILAGIVIANLNPARETAKNARAASDIGQYLIGLRMYKERYGYYPRPSVSGTDSNWWCLGDRNPDDKCAGWSGGNSTFEENEAINNALRNVMSTVPSGTDKIHIYQGYAYRCADYDGPGNCTSFNLGWFLYGPDQDCSPGVQNSNHSGTEVTYCRYDR